MDTKRTLYVGGLAPEVNESLLEAAFRPFGEIASVFMPHDASTHEAKHRGFGFVGFEEEDDAKAALDNMNKSEIFGRTLNVNFAQPYIADTSKPIWSDASYFEKKDQLEKEGALAIKDVPNE